MTLDRHTYNVQVLRCLKALPPPVFALDSGVTEKHMYKLKKNQLKRLISPHQYKTENQQVTVIVIIQCKINIDYL